jgi:hypothetical protein
MSESTRKLIILISKAGLVVILTGIFLAISGDFFARYTPWQKYMNPRQCLLWRGHFDGTQHVMIGDSAFCSYYIDSPDKTIWARVETLVNQEIFPGALDGCMPADFLSQTRLVAASWPAGTTVFVDIVPTRFLYSKLPEPADGNYDDKFGRLVLNYDLRDKPAKFLKNAAKYYIKKSSFFLWNDTALKTFTDGMYRPSVYYKRGMHFNRIWSRSGDFAIERFQTFEKNAMPDKGLKSFNWALQIHTMLAQKGLRAVFVLTPLNKDLVWAYTSPDSARFLIGYLDYAHNEFKSFLTINRMTSIDLYGAADRNEFADLVHTNEKGDDTIARAMAVWIKNNPYQATLSQISH